MVRLTCLALAAAFIAQLPAPRTDLDALMARALERRDIDRAVLDDYIVDETETVTITGPNQARLYGSRREYSYYVRDGFHVRSPVRVDGVPVPDGERRAYEDEWLKSERARRAYRSDKASEREALGRPTPPGVPSVNEPRFVSEAYFLDFSFDPGNYYLAGRGTHENRDVLLVEYYPTRLFNGDETEAIAFAKKPPPARKASTAELERKLNKTSVVTLWVDPQADQIVKYSFTNVKIDFLPGHWLVQMDDVAADMEMRQAFPGVWLPDHVIARAHATTAAGAVAMEYAREFSNYRRAEVSTRISVAKPGGR